MKSVSKTWSQSNNFLRLIIDDSNIKVMMHTLTWVDRLSSNQHVVGFVRPSLLSGTFTFYFNKPIKFSCGFPPPPTPLFFLSLMSLLEMLQNPKVCFSSVYFYFLVDKFI